MRLTILLLAIVSSILLAIHTVRPASVAAHPPIDHEDGTLPTTPISSPSLGVGEQPPERSMVGTLDQVDDQASAFVVKTTTGKLRFVLQSGATIRQGSKTIKASELASHRGERIKVRYRESAGERRAEWIVVASPPSHKAKPQEN